MNREIVATTRLPIRFPDHGGHTFPPDTVETALTDPNWVRDLDVSFSRQSIAEKADWTYYGTIDSIAIESGGAVADVSLSAEGARLVKAGCVLAPCLLLDAVDEGTGRVAGMRILGISLAPKHRAVL